MGRKKGAKKRIAQVDTKYRNTLIAKFINKIMFDGKKSKAEDIVYGAFSIIEQKVKEEPPLEVFKKALKNVQPKVELKARRIGGATYQVPIEVRPDRSIALGMRWIIDYARGRKGKAMEAKLAEEIMQAHKKEGSSVKKREDMHKMAEANRAFAHFRW
ncbi:MAG: 30S ribosomal protein S7 [Candidatus Omnitrophica bacterium]|nr:30S ribosomal protein S7 [Candidatus Omnitrophota bacterium]MBU1047020.1 30S ribosomal protein S7 [Candidatus Omnitrophota bacterium]MBU1630241.1 30S ribosomal protein S7 [Candidatus Omnitrophota bacterium]MBU1766835.1 30S ribosomal protein S7 [Candidatus Omnitrophota bacterium]MBU1889614.1 30S ribosomal protein S7 [Candidatus Omnitrophota bacterium]